MHSSTIGVGLAQARPNKPIIKLYPLKLPVSAAEWEEDNSNLTKTLVPAVLQDHCVDDKNKFYVRAFMVISLQSTEQFR